MKALPTPPIDGLALDSAEGGRRFGAVEPGQKVRWLDGKIEPASRGFHGRLLPRCVTIAEGLQAAVVQRRRHPSLKGELVSEGTLSYRKPALLRWEVVRPESMIVVMDGDGEEYDGVRGFFQWLERKKYKVHVRVFLSRYRGYTQCPDVCPTTLSTMRDAMKLLGGDANRVQVLFVTVDPQRDTAELLGHYVPAFDPSFLGLRGDAAALERTAREFKIVYQKQPEAPGFIPCFRNHENQFLRHAAW